MNADVNKGRVTSVVTARIPVEHKILLFDEANKNNMGISEYLSMLLMKHCINCEKRITGIQLELGGEVKEAPKKPHAPRKEVEKAPTPKTAKIEVEDVLPDKILKKANRTKRDEIIEQTTKENGDVDWTKYKKMSKEAGLYDEKLQEFRRSKKQK